MLTCSSNIIYIFYYYIYIQVATRCMRTYITHYQPLLGVCEVVCERSRRNAQLHPLLGAGVI
jgi:hypothetical protein